ncbi:hypothetical protein FOZ60_015769 [Perkinsus olseni]|uniref:Uncharacterized protein n=1 Tax=Perkinsus olseni TaxID=32597 RepID=A0A7J6P5E9_PEROL|nr:hypothetical protein FOZ60_015769 [Perkinsus olseni]
MLGLRLRKLVRAGWALRRRPTYFLFTRLPRRPWVEETSVLHFWRARVKSRRERGLPGSAHEVWSDEDVSRRQGPSRSKPRDGAETPRLGSDAKRGSYIQRMKLHKPEIEVDEERHHGSTSEEGPDKSNRVSTGEATWRRILSRAQAYYSPSLADNK